ncbi:MAG: hypothetical protein J6T72_00220 [Alphaproteobacteria bacterium]|nr:hypothetical protein [Alphaproteobacteria bacterium]
MHRAGIGKIAEMVSVGMANEQARLANDKNMGKYLEIWEFLLHRKSKIPNKNGIIISIKLNWCKKSYLSNTNGYTAEDIIVTVIMNGKKNDLIFFSLFAKGLLLEKNILYETEGIMNAKNMAIIDIIKLIFIICAPLHLFLVFF